MIARASPDSMTVENKANENTTLSSLVLLFLSVAGGDDGVMVCVELVLNAEPALRLHHNKAARL